MSSAVEEYLLYQINNAHVRKYPYPHIYVENVFPPDFYAQVRANWPDSSSLISLSDTGRVSKGAYAERFILPFLPADIATLQEDRCAFWMEFGSWFMADRFLNAMVAKFQEYARGRFGKKLPYCKFHADALLVRDRTNYSIGPHTDSPRRLLSLLFYCPDDARRKHLGTSIYVPVDPGFRNDGGRHFPFRGFRKVATMEYKPNSLFAFFKTNNSFHGVEAITEENVERDVLLYDIQVINASEGESSTVRRFAEKVGLRMLGRLLGSKGN